MKAKKVLTTALAVTMMFSTMVGTSVMAEEIDSGTIFIDQDVYDLTLPTTASQKFYIDPQGLIALGKSGAAANSGTVTGAFNMYAVNRSSKPIALSVSYKLIDSAESDGVAAVTALADDDAIAALKADAGRKIAVSVSAVESATDADSDGNDCGGKVFKADDSSGVDIMAASGNLSTADAVYAGIDAAATAAYLMTAETYKAQLKEGKTAEDAYDANSYEYVIDTSANKASCVKLTIGGYCSEKADWSNYADGTETLKLDVVFKFKKVTTTAGDYSDAKASGDEVVIGPRVSMTADGAVTIAGLTAERNITKTADVVVVDATDNYPFGDNTVTFDISGWTSEEGGTVAYQLKSDWKVLNDHSVKIQVTLSDGSTITSNEVTLALD